MVQKLGGQQALFWIQTFESHESTQTVTYIKPFFYFIFIFYLRLIQGVLSMVRKEMKRFGKQLGHEHRSCRRN